MKKMMRLFATACFAVVLAFGCLCLAGCGQSDEEVLKSGLTEALDELKALDDDTLDEMDSSGSFSALDSQFSSYGIDSKSFIKSLLGDFDYEISSIEVEKDTAHVTMEATVKDISKMNSAVEKKAKDYVTKHASELRGMSTAEQNKLIGNLVMEALDELGTTQKTVEFDVNKEGNEWQMDEALGYTIGYKLFS